jgi:rhamnogalacturonan hydrolase
MSEPHLIKSTGTIYRIGTSGGNMIAVTSTSDFEFYSANSKGAIQGYGYELNTGGASGPRLIRLTSVTSFSFHDIALVDGLNLTQACMYQADARSSSHVPFDA